MNNVEKKTALFYTAWILKLEENSISEQDTSKKMLLE